MKNAFLILMLVSLFGNKLSGQEQKFLEGTLMHSLTDVRYVFPTIVPYEDRTLIVGSVGCCCFNFIPFHQLVKPPHNPLFSTKLKPLLAQIVELPKIKIKI